MNYYQSESDFSNFVINSLSTFVSESKSEYDDFESDFSSVLVNLDVCVILPYIFILLNKLADDLFYQYL